MKVYTDGATEGHNGRLGTVTHVGVGVWVPDLKLSISKRLEGISNNEAEFLALIAGLELCLSEGIKSPHFMLDSKIVVNRANGKRPKGKWKNERMDAFQDKVLELTRQVGSCKFQWIPREKNYKADALSKNALL